MSKTRTDCFWRYINSYFNSEQFFFSLLPHKIILNWTESTKCRTHRHNLFPLTGICKCPQMSLFYFSSFFFKWRFLVTLLHSRHALTLNAILFRSACFSSYITFCWCSANSELHCKTFNGFINVVTPIWLFLAHTICFFLSFSFSFFLLVNVL